MKYSWMLSVVLGTSLMADGVLDESLIAGSIRPSKPVEKQPKEEVAPQPVAPQYDNRFGFSYDRLVYERTKPKAMYFGVDAWVGMVWNHARHHNHWDAIAEGEIRLGYNLFYNGRDHVTPLVGVGYLYDNVGRFHHARFAYATAGFLYSHEFNTVFGWGLNLKGLAGQQVGKSEPKKFAWGVDVAVPIIFRFSHYRHWDVTLEPYFIYMSFTHRHQGVVGGRGTIGYRF